MKRLVIDLETCEFCEACAVRCDYFYRPHPQEEGITTLRERATFQILCRRCEEASCVDACRFDALERQPDGILKRYNLRCVSCGCCVQACPFGTIYPELVPFYQTPCDYCQDRMNGEPFCVNSCPYQAIEYREVGASEAGVHIVDDTLAVRSAKWNKKEPVP